jgi:hypothetical protein
MGTASPAGKLRRGLSKCGAVNAPECTIAFGGETSTKIGHFLPACGACNGRGFALRSSPP